MSQNYSCDCFSKKCKHQYATIDNEVLNDSQSQPPQQQPEMGLKEENSFEKEVMELITNLKFEFCETYHMSRRRYVECDKCADTEQKFGFKWIQLNQGWLKN